MIISFAKPHAKGCDCQEIQLSSYSIVGGKKALSDFPRSLAPPRRISPLSFWQTCRSGRSRDASLLRPLLRTASTSHLQPPSFDGGGICYVGPAVVVVISESYSGGGKNCPPRSETPCKEPKFLPSTGNNFVFKLNSYGGHVVCWRGISKRGHSPFQNLSIRQSLGITPNYTSIIELHLHAIISDPLSGLVHYK